MLKKIHLSYYRCFKDASLTFKELAIIVGCNNAGKSTLIEALRMIAFAVRKCTKTTYITAPSRLKLPVVIKGFRIATEQLRIDLKSVIYQFQENKLATIEVTFDSQVKIKIYIDNSIAFATVYDPNGNNIKTRNAAKQLELDQVNIMPQIGLIREDETRLTQKTVLEDMDTRLASRHFRNEILLFKDKYYDEFKQMAETTWNGLRIDSLEARYGNNPISLIVYDAEFASEIGQMGSGLQMWLQIIWFLSRCEPNSTVILDEPDAYMHPDMQRKILKLVVHKFNQIIIATHSIEIISEVKPTNIVTVL